MSMVEQIKANLVDPDSHAPILKALLDILEEQGEKGVKDRIRRWVREIEAEIPPSAETKE